MKDLNIISLVLQQKRIFLIEKMDLFLIDLFLVMMG